MQEGRSAGELQYGHDAIIRCADEMQYIRSEEMTEYRRGARKYRSAPLKPDCAVDLPLACHCACCVRNATRTKRNGEERTECGRSTYQTLLSVKTKSPCSGQDVPTKSWRAPAGTEHRILTQFPDSRPPRPGVSDCDAPDRRLLAHRI